MTNPFTHGATQTSIFDLPGDPVQNAKRVADAAAAESHVVSFDAAARTASPAGKAFIKHIFDAVADGTAEQIDDVVKGLSKMLAEEVEPLLDRIAALEVALDLKRQKTAETVLSRAAEFTAPAPTLEQLDDMAKRHAATMKEKGLR